MESVVTGALVTSDGYQLKIEGETKTETETMHLLFN